MLVGRLRLPSKWRSRNTIRAANKPCSVTGSMITLCMAPLMKRRASGHLRAMSVGSILRHRVLSTFWVSVLWYVRRVLLVSDDGAFPAQRVRVD